MKAMAMAKRRITEQFNNFGGLTVALTAGVAE